jgi:hypothetical protein
MIQLQEQEAVIRKIKALLSKTEANGASEGEAFNAMQAAGQLLKTYNLTLDKVFIGSQSCIQEKIYTGSHRKNAVSSVVSPIAKFCDCKVWSGKDILKGVYYAFFGLPADVEMAKYLYELVSKSIEQETNNYKLSDDYINGDVWESRKTKSVSFQHGMANRIASRLNELNEDRYTENIENEEKTGTDIVLIKKSKIEDDFNKLGLKLKTVYSSKSARSAGAYGSGSEAGSKINFNRPVGAASSIRGYLS